MSEKNNTNKILKIAKMKKNEDFKKEEKLFKVKERKKVEKRTR